MKFLLIATLLMSTAFANHHDEKGKTVEEIKTKVSAHIDQKISSLQAHKACVQGASTKEALKACRDSHKDEMKKHRHDRKEKKVEKKKK